MLTALHRSIPYVVRNKLHTAVWLAVSVVAVGCDSRDDTVGSHDVKQPNSGLVAADDTPISTENPSSQLLTPNAAVATPAALQLQTQEEQPVNGLFSLEDESNEVVFPAQTYTVVVAPQHGVVTHTSPSRQFTYVPEMDFFGTDSFTYSISAGLQARVTIEVINVNDPPVLFAEVQLSIEQGMSYSATLIAIDPDNEQLEFSAANLPSWLSLDTASGLLSGVPGESDVGLFEDISFNVSDPSGLSSEASNISIEVIGLNDAPSINLDQFPNDLDAGQSIDVHLFPDDPDGDPVELAFEPNDFLDISVTGGTVSVVAANVAEVTKINLVLLATDIRGGVTRSVVPITIYPINATGSGRTLFGRAASGAGIHLVVLGDGYRVDQQAKFREHVETLIEKMQADVGMQTHFAAWNIHMVETPSVDSGSDDNVALDQRDTVFGTGYFCKGVRRLICGDKLKIYNVAIREYPNFDQILVLVNDSRYGGSGGNIAISSTESIEIALHELGHSIAGLADEYVDQYIPGTSIPDFTEGRYANISNSNDPALVPWRHWLSNDSLTNNNINGDIGIYEGAYYRAAGYFRPTPNSLMRSYDGALGPINSEQWALSVYNRTNPVLEISPVNRLLNIGSGEVVDFSVLPMFDSKIQSVQWQLDSRVIPDSGTGRPSVSLSFPPGQFEVAVIVRDISGLIRRPEPHAGLFQRTWTVVVK